MTDESTIAQVAAQLEASTIDLRMHVHDAEHSSHSTTQLQSLQAINACLENACTFLHSHQDTRIARRLSVAMHVIVNHSQSVNNTLIIAKELFPSICAYSTLQPVHHAHALSKLICACCENSPLHFIILSLPAVIALSACDAPPVTLAPRVANCLLQVLNERLQNEAELCASALLAIATNQSDVLNAQVLRCVADARDSARDHMPLVVKELDHILAIADNRTIT